MGVGLALETVELALEEWGSEKNIYCQLLKVQKNKNKTKQAITAHNKKEINTQIQGHNYVLCNLIQNTV